MTPDAGRPAAWRPLIIRTWAASHWLRRASSRAALVRRATLQVLNFAPLASARNCRYALRGHVPGRPLCRARSNITRPLRRG